MQIPPQKCVQKNAYKTENDIVNCELRKCGVVILARFKLCSWWESNFKHMQMLSYL